MSAKTSLKTPQPVRYMPGANGGKLRRGNPGNRGGPGRPPNTLRDLCREILADAEVQAALWTAARDPQSRGFASVIKLLASYAEGPPLQRHEVEASKPLPPLLVKLVHKK